MNSQDILNYSLSIGVLTLITLIGFVSFYIIKVMKSTNNAIKSISSTASSIKNIKSEIVYASYSLFDYLINKFIPGGDKNARKK